MAPRPGYCRRGRQVPEQAKGAGFDGWPEGADQAPGSPGRDQPDAVVEYHFTCKLCGAVESWTTRQSTDLAALWHLKNVHPEDWAMLQSDPETEPADPGWHGSRVEGKWVP